jgi:hypothetical protein
MFPVFAFLERIKLSFPIGKMGELSHYSIGTYTYYFGTRE